MPVVTYQALIENGQVRLPPDVVLPEKQTVYVVVPDAGSTFQKLPSVRLADPTDAAKFELTVLWGEDR
jgi:hypothetical protein